MAEIIVSSPQINTMSRLWRRYSYSDSSMGVMGKSRREFYKALKDGNLNPETSPLVAELAAGDGSYAGMLVQRGWPETNITCFDIHESPEPLVPNANWRYWDLAELSEALASSRPLPEGVEALRGRFDLAVSEHPRSFDPKQKKFESDSILQFFVRPGGYYYHGGTLHGSSGEVVRSSQSRLHFWKLLK